MTQSPPDPEATTARRDAWLLDHRRNVASQFGEDGILEKALELLDERDGWCVKFGAYDGLFWSNTRNLIVEHGYRAVLIEANRRRFQQLSELYRDHPEIVLLDRFITLEGPNSLDGLLTQTEIPRDFDLLSIDVDGNDYHLWDSLREHRPKLVIIEFNPTIPPELEVVQPADRQSDSGASLLALCNLGKSKGYELISATDANAIFVRREDFPRFGIADNRPEVLWREFMPLYIMRLYQKFDGTLVLAGNDRLIWHRMKIPQWSIQVLPFFLRFYPGNDNAFLRFLKRIYYRFFAKESRPDLL